MIRGTIHARALQSLRTIQLERDRVSEPDVTAGVHVAVDGGWEPGRRYLNLTRSRDEHSHGIRHHAAVSTRGECC